MIRRRDTSRGVRWDVIWREQDRRQRSRTFRTKRDAQAFEAERHRDRAMGAFRRDEPSRMTLGEFMDAWLTTNAAAWSPNTTRIRASAYGAWIAPALGGTALADLGTSRIREFQSQLASSTTPGNTRNIMSILSAALGAAVSDGLIPYNPCASVKRVRASAPTRRRPTYGEIRRVLPYLARPSDRLRAALMLMAGLRPSEASALRWSDVHDDYLVVGATIQGGKLHQTKTGTVRTVPIHRDLHVELSLVDRGRGWVAPAPAGGPVNVHNYSRRVLAPAGRRAGVHVTQYDMRHACATHMLVDLGLPPVLVASWLGHSPAVLMDTYADAITPYRARSAP